MPNTTGWSTQQLTEFLTAIGSIHDERTVLRHAVERIAEAVEAELGLITLGDRPAAWIGFGTEPPLLVGRTGWPSGQHAMELEGLGRCIRWTARLEEGIDGALHIVRVGDEPFTGEERGLLRGMVRILSLQLRSLALVEAESAARQQSERHAAEVRGRQRVLESLTVVQRMITDRAPLLEIMDAVTRGASLLTGDTVVSVRLVDHEDPTQWRIVSSLGLTPEARALVDVGPIGSGAGGMAITEGRLIVLDDYPSHPNAIAAIVDSGITAAMSAPLRAEGTIAGSLVVASLVPGRRYSKTEQETLLAYAEQASLALTDAARTRAMIHAALHDPLTGLPNRALFLERLGERLTRKVRAPHTRAALLFLDLDQLKRINDSLGHPAGDALLTAIAGRLRELTRPADMVARLSGDEFIVLLDDVANVAAASDVAERLIAAISEPVDIDGRRLTVTGSVGIRMVDEDTVDALDAMRGADLAMYEAKGRGGGRWALYRSELNDRAQRRFALEGELRTALDDDAFQLAYQPIIDLATGSVLGAEALLRWRHPVRGPIAPDTFIPLAEETGLIVPIGERVLTMAAAEALRWDPTDGTPIHLNVNVSVRQLNEPGFVASIERILGAAGLSPRRLTLEITESVLVQEMSGLVQPLIDLRDLGVKLSIDDFGTGYSSLSYLQRLPIDSVKIDRSFINHVADGPRPTAFVRAIVEMCRSLDLRTVAEGVETAAQATALRALRCEQAQGYHFARPLSPVAFRSFLKTSRPIAREIVPLGIQPAETAVRPFVLAAASRPERSRSRRLPR